MKRNKKTIIPVILILAACILLLAGFARKKSVDLLKDNLIDLDKAIELAEWGSEDNGQKDGEIKDGKPVADTDTKIVSTIKVRVYGKEVFIDGEKCELSDVKKTLRAKFRVGNKVRLIDDYAEAHVYRDVDKAITDLSKTLGFEYDAD